MTVPRPDPGNLIKTVDQLVDAVNDGGGGGSIDWSDVEAPIVNFTATAGDFIASIPNGDFIQLLVDGSSSELQLSGTGATLGAEDTLLSLDSNGLTIQATALDIESQQTVNINAGATWDVQISGDGGSETLSVGASGIAIGNGNASIGFYGTSPIAQPTGVPITAAGIHAALVALGLITS